MTDRTERGSSLTTSAYMPGASHEAPDLHHHQVAPRATAALTEPNASLPAPKVQHVGQDAYMELDQSMCTMCGNIGTDLLGNPCTMCSAGLETREGTQQAVAQVQAAVAACAAAANGMAASIASAGMIGGQTVVPQVQMLPPPPAVMPGTVTGRNPSGASLSQVAPADTSYMEPPPPGPTPQLHPGLHGPGWGPPCEEVIYPGNTNKMSGSATVPISVSGNTQQVLPPPPGQIWSPTHLPTLHQESQRAPESPGREKGSYIRAASGKVYWLNHDDPLDLQRLPDAAASSAAAAENRWRRALAAAAVGGEAPGGNGATPALTEGGAEIVPMYEEPLLPETPDPTRDHRVQRLRSAPSASMGGLLPSDNASAPLMRMLSGLRLPSHQHHNNAASDPDSGLSGWAVIHREPSATLPVHREASAGATTIPGPPANFTQTVVATRSQVDNTVSQVARRNLSEPRLGAASGTAAGRGPSQLPGHGPGQTAVAPPPPRGALTQRARSAAPGVATPARGALTQRSLSPAPWSPAAAAVHTQTPLSARPRADTTGLSGRSRLNYGAVPQQLQLPLQGSDSARLGDAWVGINSGAAAGSGADSARTASPAYLRGVCVRPPPVLRRVNGSVTVPPAHSLGVSPSGNGSQGPGHWY